MFGDMGHPLLLVRGQGQALSGLNSEYVTVETSSLHPRCTPLIPFTDRTVVSSPAWVTAAKPGVWEEGSVARTLVQARGPGRLTVGSSPSHGAVALASHTDTPARTCGIHAVHCDMKEREHR